MNFCSDLIAFIDITIFNVGICSYLGHLLKMMSFKKYAMDFLQIWLWQWK